MGRLIIVSNRVPSPHERVQPVGGLTVGLADVVRGVESLWFGWSGQHAEGAAAQDVTCETVAGVTYATIDLTSAQHERYYEHFSNDLIWPLFHYRPGIITYHRQDLAAYYGVNDLFADRLAPLLRPDDTIWVHDYHLIPLGQALRARGVTGKIGFFLHIPCPPWSVMRVLPCAEELLRAMAAYDLIGVQTDEDARNLGECYEVMGLDPTVRAFPIGIDPRGFEQEAKDNVGDPEVRRLRESLRGRKLIIGVDRLDYSKGLLERLHGYEAFLKRFPEHLRGVIFVQIAPPSREGVANYQALRRELDELVGFVNGKHADFDWTPIRYLTQPVPRHLLASFHRLADVALVTPLRDGMNLVAKEFVAAQDDADPGVLILSHFAGAAPDMPEALLVNPYDTDEIADALHQALTMPLDARQKRWRALRAEVGLNTAAEWAKRFLSTLEASAPSS
ncbi:alpha,alpha-trehalose-phosphate synthase (UDP-forming) [Acidomonas methanolica]|uniref:Alpha,alpha-trehalose-phosphate synthase n=1 Tax=Acidomonas methanolica NBRC 104435 TaxID=1231351 RepID=A0A023D993_ACIMT|nr:trehalose-6-phosphate synthase [Acidomonas methanolica]MBU2653845.1 trehalose-6-phosphate synthase [Acidomonas methanolica]TCS20569.1 trehalose 6-phosphate synthase [Acidomonas methanolica]GAJ30722.1 alpha,alpha-trehalose-phosphate synthase [Acidomonas methanolica NBRC 104435]GBQ59665.1 alpha,alpha-trehalose-phosphate synthase [Acidomonas methanolica]GEL00525.1 alpha,alpha-trehalose-phosphate synthase (UDP-forming) [Acidomonas methanolica NBRC 104435]